VISHERGKEDVIVTYRGHDKTFYGKVCQSLAAGRWFSPGTPVSSFNKTDLHDTTEILLKVALDTITLTHIHP
jgi:hypothetical protein